MIIPGDGRHSRVDVEFAVLHFRDSLPYRNARFRCDSNLAFLQVCCYAEMQGLIVIAFGLQQNKSIHWYLLVKQEMTMTAIYSSSISIYL